MVFRGPATGCKGAEAWAGAPAPGVGLLAMRLDSLRFNKTWRVIQTVMGEIRERHVRTVDPRLGLRLTYVPITSERKGFALVGPGNREAVWAG